MLRTLATRQAALLGAASRQRCIRTHGLGRAVGGGCAARPHRGLGWARSRLCRHPRDSASARRPPSRAPKSECMGGADSGVPAWRQGRPVLWMPSGDVRDNRAKLRPQPRRALWQAGQQPCAPRLGVGGPAPVVGGAGATSGPDVSPQPHPGGAGYWRWRPRRAALTEGAGTPERVPAARSRVARGRGREQGWAPLAGRYEAGPIPKMDGAYPASGSAHANRTAPLSDSRRSGYLSRESGTRTHDVRGR